MCGFSLVEVVLVVIIISIVAVMAVPRFAQSMARHRVDSATRRIVVDLQLAKQLAKTTSKQHRVRFVYGTNKYVIESLEGATWTAIADMNKPGAVYEVDLGAEPYLSKVGNIRRQSLVEDPMVVYDGFGAVTKTVWLILQNGETFKKIDVDNTTGEPVLTVVDSASFTLDEIELASPSPHASPAVQGNAANVTLPTVPAASQKAANASNGNGN